MLRRGRRQAGTAPFLASYETSREVSVSTCVEWSEVCIYLSYEATIFFVCAGARLHPYVLEDLHRNTMIDVLLHGANYGRP